MRCARCSRARSARRTRRSGSTPACTGRTASPARARPLLRRSQDRRTDALATNAYEHPAPHACLPYRALVSTPDGPIPIGEIVARNLIGLQVYDAEGTTRVVAVKHNGVKAVYRVTLKTATTSKRRPTISCSCRRWSNANEMAVRWRISRRTCSCFSASNCFSAGLETSAYARLRAQRCRTARTARASSSCRRSSLRYSGGDRRVDRIRSRRRRLRYRDREPHVPDQQRRRPQLLHPERQRRSRQRRRHHGPVGP